MTVSQFLKLQFVYLSYSFQQCPPRRLTISLGVVVLLDPLLESFTPAVTRLAYGVVDEVKGQTEVDDKLLPVESQSRCLHDNEVPVISCNVHNIKC